MVEDERATSVVISDWKDDLAFSTGMYRILRMWMESEAQRWFAFRRSARDRPYLRATPARESVGVTYSIENLNRPIGIGSYYGE